MANFYKYGTYGEVVKSLAQSAVQSGTIAVYIGTAPVNLVRDYAEKNIVNFPVQVTNDTNAQSMIGYSPNWKKYTICEAQDIHFSSQKKNVGPITVINVLDPDVHRKAEATDAALAFVNGRAQFVSDTIILDTFAIADKVEDVDYALDYDYTRSLVIVTSLNPDAPLMGEVNASFYEVTPEAVTPEEIIGGKTAGGEYSGISAIELIYMNLYQVPNILAAPGWSHIPAVYNKLVSESQQINGHWNAYVVADIPIVDESGSVDTIDKAKAWKTAKGFASEYAKVYWPMAQDNVGRKIHLSTLAVYTMLDIDQSHNSIPMETPGNISVPVVKHYFGEGSKNRGYDQRTANELTSAGISTVVAWGGQWVLWGDHTAAYSYGADLDPRGIFDVSMRMLMHITNSFQREWGTTIDQPMTRKLADRIINREQEKLDALVVIGALIGEPKVEFLEEENSLTDIMNGDFVWNIQCTPTPPLKSATVRVAYTDAGFTVYYEGGDE